MCIAAIVMVYRIALSIAIPSIWYRIQIILCVCVCVFGWVGCFPLCQHETISCMHYEWRNPNTKEIKEKEKKRHSQCYSMLVALLIHRVFVCWIVNIFKVKIEKNVGQSAGGRVKYFSKTPYQMKIASLTRLQIILPYHFSLSLESFWWMKRDGIKVAPLKTLILCRRVYFFLLNVIGDDFLTYKQKAGF